MSRSDISPSTARPSIGRPKLLPEEDPNALCYHGPSALGSVAASCAGPRWLRLSSRTLLILRKIAQRRSTSPIIDLAAGPIVFVLWENVGIDVSIFAGNVWGPCSREYRSQR